MTNLARSLSIIAVAQVFSVAATQITLLILARLLLPEDLGVYAVCAVFVSMSTSIATLGLDAAVIQRQTKTNGVLGTASSLRLISGTSFCIVTFLVAPYLAAFVGNASVTGALRITSLVFILSALGFETSTKLAKHLRFYEMSLTKTAYVVAWCVSALAFALGGFGYWSLVYAHVIGCIVLAISLWLVEPWRIGYPVEWRKGKSLLSYGSYLMGTWAITTATFSLDKFVVGHSLGTATLGAYWIAFNYGYLAPLLMTSIVSTVMFPFFSAIQDHRQQLVAQYIAILRLMSYVSVPIAMGISAMSPTIVSSLLGNKWAEATIPLSILSLFGLAASLSSPGSNVILAIGKPRSLFAQTLVTSVVYFVLLIPMIELRGLTTLSLLFVMIGICSLLWMLTLVAMNTGISVFNQLMIVAKPLIASSVFPVVCPLIRLSIGDSIVSLTIQLATGLAAYLGLLVALTRGEAITQIKEFIASVFR